MEKIYTFWDGEMPDYIKLCIGSWKKHLKNFEIVVLNFQNLDEYIGKDFYDKFLYETFTVAQQTQAIRAAVLEKYGGWWFDADIIVTSDRFLEFFDNDAELTILSDRIACLRAKKGAKILKKWINGIKWNIWLYKYFFEYNFEHHPNWACDMMKWDYLSMNILRSLFKTKNKKSLKNVDIYKARFYPEWLWNKELGKRLDDQPAEMYGQFYIKNDFTGYALGNNDGLIILHNSWMPRNFSKLSKDEIFKQNNTIAGVLKSI